MEFGVRKEDSKWYLCIKYGRIIKGTKRFTKSGWVDIVFPNRATAKECADHLNKYYTFDYERCIKLSYEEATALYKNNILDLEAVIFEHMNTTFEGVTTSGLIND